MLKLVDPASFGMSDPVLELIKVSSRGLIGYDRSVFEKRASPHILTNVDDLIKQAKSDEPLIHLIAMGSTEYTGPNRNGDGWTSATLRETHPTFVKHAMFYRDHKNRDPKKSYGRVVKSAFNEAMPRVELIVALNGSEEAAKRHDGLFADKELQKLASGKETSVSMACKLPFDLCSYCGNEARTPDLYCRGTNEGGKCAAGGLRNKMGSLADVNGDLHHLHADNPAKGLSFFDISHVFRPADRTAYVIGELTKRASSGEVIKSAELAEALGLTIPEIMFDDAFSDPNVSRLIKTAYALSDVEQSIEGSDKYSDTYNSYAFSDSSACDDLQNVKLAEDNFSSFLGALARNKIALPVQAFLQVFTGQHMAKCAQLAELVKPVLPGIYTRMLQDVSLGTHIKQSSYSPAFADSASPAYVRAYRHLQDFCISKESVEKRATRACLQLTNNTFVKTATNRPDFTGDALVRLAREYALYKLAFVASTDCTPFEVRMAVLQNYCT